MKKSIRIIESLLNLIVNFFKLKIMKIFKLSVSLCFMPQN